MKKGSRYNLRVHKTRIENQGHGIGRNTNLDQRFTPITTVTPKKRSKLHIIAGEIKS